MLQDRQAGGWRRACGRTGWVGHIGEDGSFRCSDTTWTERQGDTDALDTPASLPSPAEQGQRAASGTCFPSSSSSLQHDTLCGKTVRVRNRGRRRLLLFWSPTPLCKERALLPVLCPWGFIPEGSIEPWAGLGLLSGQGLTGAEVSGGHQGGSLQIISQISSLGQHPPSVRVDEVASGYGPCVATGWKHRAAGARNH